MMLRTQWNQNNIKDLAMHCYKDGGGLVYMARNLSNIYLHENYSDENFEQGQIQHRKGNGTRSIGFELDAQANVNIYLVNGSTGLIQSHILIDNSMLPTSHIISFDDSSLPTGQHYITITADKDLISVPFIKN